jgi:hypothetical protein
MRMKPRNRLLNDHPFALNKTLKLFTGTAGVPPAMSAKREKRF